MIYVVASQFIVFLFAQQKSFKQMHNSHYVIKIHASGLFENLVPKTNSEIYFANKITGSTVSILKGANKTA